MQQNKIIKIADISKNTDNLQIPAPDDKSYRNFISYIAGGSGAKQPIGQLFYFTGESSSENSSLADSSVCLLHIVERINDSINAGRNPTYKFTPPTTGADSEKEAKSIAALSRLGMIVHNENTNEIALTKLAVEYLLDGVKNFDAEHGLTTSFTKSQFRYTNNAFMEKGRTNI